VNKLTDVRYVLILLSTVFAVGVALLIGFQIRRSHDEAIQSGYRDVNNLATNLAQHTRQSFLAVDLVLQGLTTPEFAPLFGDPERNKKLAYATLRNRKAALQAVVDILVLGPDGRLRFTSSTADPQPVDLSTQPAFLAAREHVTAGLTISPPFIAEDGPYKGRYIMILSRPMEAIEGQFLGTVQAVLRLDYFEEFYQSLDIGPHGVIGVVRWDGMMVMRHPIIESMLGASIETNEVYLAHRTHPVWGQVQAKGMRDGIQRIMAYRDVPEVNLFVAVGLANEDILASWRRGMVIESIAAGALIVLVLLLAAAASRLLTAQEAEKEKTIARLNRLAEASADIALVHHRQALIESVDRVVRYLFQNACATLKLDQDEASTRSIVEARRISVPLRGKAGSAAGSLEIVRTDGADFNQQDVALLIQLAHGVTAALENLELLEQSRDLAVQAERAKDDEAEARRAIENVYATMSEGVYALDREGRFTFVNHIAERMLSKPKEQLYGRTFFDELPHLRGTMLHERFIRCYTDQKPAEFQIESGDDDGAPRWTDIRAFPTKDGITIYGRDVTQRVETEAKLRQSQKMEAIGQLTGGMAHDFNNLLTVVLGSADTLVDSLTSKDHLRRIAESIRDAALRGATLVARLLAFARRQALAPETVNVNDLVSGLEDLLKRTIGENIHVEIRQGKSTGHANIDPVQMENAILNLALNARDAMPEGGRLVIETNSTYLGPEVHPDSKVDDSEYVVVAVTDTGAGMSPEVVQRAFDPFFTTKPIGAGSGLGLSMVYGFVRQSGGQVRINSTVGEGTTVSMYLPAVPAHDVAANQYLEQDNSPLGHEKILLVEDDELVRAHLAETLASLGYQVVPCADGQEVLGIIKSGVQADLLLTDIILGGGINGHRVAEQIKELRPSMPVLYMSGYTENAIASDGLLDPGIHFISKPFRRHQIAAKLRAVFAA